LIAPIGQSERRMYPFIPPHFTLNVSDFFCMSIQKKHKLWPFVNLAQWLRGVPLYHFFELNLRVVVNDNN